MPEDIVGPHGELAQSAAREAELADALRIALDMAEELYGWIVNEFDPDPGPLSDYLTNPEALALLKRFPRGVSKAQVPLHPCDNCGEVDDHECWFDGVMYGPY